MCKCWSVSSPIHDSGLTLLKFSSSSLSFKLSAKTRLLHFPLVLANLVAGRPVVSIWNCAELGVVFLKITVILLQDYCEITLSLLKIKFCSYDWKKAKCEWVRVSVSERVIFHDIEPPFGAKKDTDLFQSLCPIFYRFLQSDKKCGDYWSFELSLVCLCSHNFSSGKLSK